MDIVLLVARLLLAGVFLVAGIGKLADLAGSRKAMESFGVPARFASLAGLALPIAEIVLAVALVPLATAWWGALGALLLLAVFLAAIGYNLAQGRTPDCHCFGQIHSEPAGPRTLIRNGILAAIAALVVAFGFDDPGTSVFGWFGDLSGVERTSVVIGTLLTAAVFGLGWLLSQVMLQNGRLLVRLDALEESLASGKPVPAKPEAAIRPNVPAPSFTLPNLDGDLVSLDALRAPGRPVLLVFSDPTCGACNLLLPSLAAWQADGRLTVALVSRGDPDANRDKVAAHGLRNVLLQEDRETALAYESDVTPSAIVILPNGTVHSHLARGSEAIKALVARTLPPAAAPQPAPQMVGQPAPALSLPDLDGTDVALDQFRGADTAVLFWNPTCGFCQRMLPDLHAWEANPPANAPKLVVVSQGSVESNRALGFRAPVLISEGGAGAPFGVRGTPSAVVIDADGTIASPVAVGAPGVLGLLNPVTATP
jgi:peroxiredoxin/uncharacterized membrane protein YphA (DoxX/SURF4 family)